MLSCPLHVTREFIILVIIYISHIFIVIKKLFILSNKKNPFFYLTSFSLVKHETTNAGPFIMCWVVSYQKQFRKKHSAVVALWYVKQLWCSVVSCCSAVKCSAVQSSVGCCSRVQCSVVQCSCKCRMLTTCFAKELVSSAKWCRQVHALPCDSTGQARRSH